MPKKIEIAHGMHSVKKAAELIGVTSSRLRQMIRAYYERCPSGKCKPTATECVAVKVEDDVFPAGHAWKVPMNEINRLKNAVPDPANGGRPRGS